MATLQPIKTVSHEPAVTFADTLSQAGIEYTDEPLRHDGAPAGETRKIVYTSPQTGKTVYVKARYDLIAGDAMGETLEYYDADFEAADAAADLAG